MKSCYMHIDVNSAFLSWIAADRLRQGDSLDIRTIPCVVGGSEEKRHGIVLAKSESAKKLFHVKTGESLAEARKKAGKDLMVVPPNHNLFKQSSEAFIQILHQYSPTIQRFSIDEAFLDYAGMEKLFGDPVDCAHRIKDEIETKLGFTVNIGVSSNKLLAKMASELEKPNKVHTLWPEEIPTKMWPLPIGELYMAGRKTAERLRSKGIITIGDLAQRSESSVRTWLNSQGTMLWNFAHGRYSEDGTGGAAFFQGMTGKDEKHAAKGIGNSSTIAFDLDTIEAAHQALLSLSETVSYRLRKSDVRARLIQVSYTTADFIKRSRQHKFIAPTQSSDELYFRACQIFDTLWDGERIRQIGIRTGELSTTEIYQTNLFEAVDHRKTRRDQTVDQLRNRFGNGALVRGTFVDSEINPMLGASWGYGAFKSNNPNKKDPDTK